jgi:serine/threonine-protein kinase PpkA
MSRRAANRLAFAIAVGFAVAGSPTDGAEDSAAIECKPPAPCIMTDVGRVLRVLPRPQSNIYADRSTNTVVEANVPAFSPLIALDRVEVSFRDPKNPSGWYKVGSNRDTPKGWMQAKDVIEWKQALVVSYSHPGIGARKRRPVLMFEDRAAAESALLDSAGAPALYAKLERGEVSRGVIAREPDRFIDIRKNFYLLPIIDYVALSKGTTGVDGHILEVAAAIPDRRARADGVCTTARPDFRDCVGKVLPEAEAVTVDVRYVVDMTSTAPSYLNAITDTMNEIATTFAGVRGLATAIKFGLIGYRSPPEPWTDDETLVKDFTGASVDHRQFTALLRNMQAKRPVLAAMAEAINGKWTEGATKLIVLIGDASAHEAPHPLAPSSYSATALRQLADEQGINIAAIYVKSPRRQAEWATGMEQFKTLATNPGGTVAFAPVESTDKAIKQKVFEGTSLMVERVGELRKAAVDLSAIGAKVAGSVDGGGLLVYLGSGAEPPRDFTAWMSDRDLSNPDLRALDVSVLVHRADLDTLTAKLEMLTEAYSASDVTGLSWFQVLRTFPTLAAVDALKLSTTLAESPLVPKWIKGLPYKSDLLSLTFEEFDSLGGSERPAMVKRIEGLIRTYKQFQASDGWIALQTGDPPAEHVFPMPLSALP